MTSIRPPSCKTDQHRSAVLVMASGDKPVQCCLLDQEPLLLETWCDVTVLRPLPSGSICRCSLSRSMNHHDMPTVGDHDSGVTDGSLWTSIRDALSAGRSRCQKDRGSRRTMAPQLRAAYGEYRGNICRMEKGYCTPSMSRIA